MNQRVKKSKSGVHNIAWICSRVLLNSRGGVGHAMFNSQIMRRKVDVVVRGEGRGGVSVPAS